MSNVPWVIGEDVGGGETGVAVLSVVSSFVLLSVRGVASDWGLTVVGDVLLPETVLAKVEVWDAEGFGMSVCGELEEREDGEKVDEVTLTTASLGFTVELAVTSEAGEDGISVVSEDGDGVGGVSVGLVTVDEDDVGEVDDADVEELGVWGDGSVWGERVGEVDEVDVKGLCDWGDGCVWGERVVEEGDALKVEEEDEVVEVEEGDDVGEVEEGDKVGEVEEGDKVGEVVDVDVVAVEEELSRLSADAGVDGEVVDEGDESETVDAVEVVELATVAEVSGGVEEVGEVEDDVRGVSVASSRRTRLAARRGRERWAEMGDKCI